MPILHLSLDRALMARLKAARDAETRRRGLHHHVPLDDVARDLLVGGLDARAARARGGQARMASQSAEQRRESARHAVQARWARVRAASET